MPDNKLKYLTADNLAKNCRDGNIRHTDLQIEKIEDRNKASWFLKAIATLQITWFLTQLVGRVASHLTITPIELFTLGYVVFALGMYYFWWHKPFDIHVPFTIRPGRIIRPSSTQSVRRSHRSTTSAKSQRTRTQSEQNNIAMWPDDERNLRRTRQRRPSSIPGLSDRTRKAILWFSRDQTFRLFLVGFTLLFSACHLAGWRYPFSTLIETWLWRVCSLMCLALPLCIIFVQFCYWQLHTDTRESIFKAVEAFTVFCVLVYLSVRICLLAQVFVALRSVPPDVYEVVSWSQYMPHI